jgi:uncharacterized protein YjiK
MFSLLFTSCSHSDNLLVHIPEASGICYAKNSNSLFVANDEGKVYEIDTKGKILRSKQLGNYDLEGVSCEEKKGKLYFAVEGADNILIVDQKNLTVQKEISIKRKFHKKLILRKDKKNGLEAIALTPDGIYLSNQAKPSVIVKIKDLKKRKVTIQEVIDHEFTDIAGLSFFEGYLYMVSDTQNLLIKYDINTNKTIWQKSLPDHAWEGVTFDDDGFIYFADDDGGVFKYLFKEL